MGQMQTQCDLPDLHTETHAAWLEGVSRNPCRRLFVTTSGYEARNRFWLQQTRKTLQADALVQHLVIGFREFADALSRPANDQFYQSVGLAIEPADASEGTRFRELVVQRVAQLLDAAKDEPVEVHVDYSCMPRLWYCELPCLLLNVLRPHDKVFLWYTPGEYPDVDYPTAGVEDFCVFSGRPSLNPRVRTHIFGLGFDRVRSQAIWSVLDPQNLVCFYADPAIRASYVERVKADNRDVLSAANHAFSVPLDNFIYAYGLIASVVTEFRTIGDVVIVPDGPKPLILASSLIPMRLATPGVLCFHVTRRKGQSYQPIDVYPIGEPFGLSFSGNKGTISGVK